MYNQRLLKTIIFFGFAALCILLTQKVFAAKHHEWKSLLKNTQAALALEENVAKRVTAVEALSKDLRTIQEKMSAGKEAFELGLLAGALESIPFKEFKWDDCEQYRNTIVFSYEPSAEFNEQTGSYKVKIPSVKEGLRTLDLLCRK